MFLTVGANGYDDAEQRSAGSHAAGAAFHRAGVRPDRLVIKAADELEPLSQRMADCLAYQRLGRNLKGCSSKLRNSARIGSTCRRPSAANSCGSLYIPRSFSTRYSRAIVAKASSALPAFFCSCAGHKTSAAPGQNIRRALRLSRRHTLGRRPRIHRSERSLRVSGHLYGDLCAAT